MKAWKGNNAMIRRRDVLLGSVALAAGCGGGGNGGTEPAGRLQVSVQWPPESRLIPQAAQSIRISVTRNGAEVGGGPRVIGRLQSLADFPGIPAGPVTVVAEAHPNADGTGTPLASVRLTAIITGGQTTPVTLNMDSTIDRVEVSGLETPLPVGTSRTLSLVAKNAAGAVVLTTPATVVWFSENNAIASVDLNGQVRGIALGMTTIRAQEKESGKIGTATVTVVSNDGRLSATVADDNPPIEVRVMVLNFDPLIPAEGNRRLHEVSGWQDPRWLADEYIRHVREASGNLVRYRIVEWKDIDAFPMKIDGFQYTAAQYRQNQSTNSGWHTPDTADYRKLLRDYGAVAAINNNTVDEVFIYGGPYFGYDESAMAGPRSFYINGATYEDVPTSRPFAIMGFNYERHVGEELHNLCHRTEATMSRVYGGWRAEELTTNWARFAANAQQSGGVAAVGTCHYPPNAQSDYDYGNPRTVQSSADDWLNYPNLTGATRPVSRESWGGPDHHQRYMTWWFAHLPRASGWNADGRLNNWWRYVYEFDKYDDRGRLRGG